MNTAPINPTNIFYATDTGITTIPQNSNPNLINNPTIFTKEVKNEINKIPLTTEEQQQLTTLPIDALELKPSDLTPPKTIDASKLNEFNQQITNKLNNTINQLQNKFTAMQPIAHSIINSQQDSDTIKNITHILENAQTEQNKSILANDSVNATDNALSHLSNLASSRFGVTNLTTDTPSDIDQVLSTLGSTQDQVDFILLICAFILMKFSRQQAGSMSNIQNSIQANSDTSGRINDANAAFLALANLHVPYTITDKDGNPHNIDDPYELLRFALGKSITITGGDGKPMTISPNDNDSLKMQSANLATAMAPTISYLSQIVDTSSSTSPQAKFWDELGWGNNEDKPDDNTARTYFHNLFTTVNKQINNDTDTTIAFFKEDTTGYFHLDEQTIGSINSSLQEGATKSSSLSSQFQLVMQTLAASYSTTLSMANSFVVDYKNLGSTLSRGS